MVQMQFRSHFKTVGENSPWNFHGRSTNFLNIDASNRLKPGRTASTENHQLKINLCDNQTDNQFDQTDRIRQLPLWSIRQERIDFEYVLPYDLTENHDLQCDYHAQISPSKLPSTFRFDRKAEILWLASSAASQIKFNWVLCIKSIERQLWQKALD